MRLPWDAKKHNTVRLNLKWHWKCQMQNETSPSFVQEKYQGVQLEVNASGKCDIQKPPRDSNGLLWHSVPLCKLLKKVQTHLHYSSHVSNEMPKKITLPILIQHAELCPHSLVTTCIRYWVHKQPHLPQVQWEMEEIVLHSSRLNSSCGLPVCARRSHPCWIGSQWFLFCSWVFSYCFKNICSSICSSIRAQLLWGWTFSSPAS